MPTDLMEETGKKKREKKKLSLLLQNKCKPKQISLFFKEKQERFDRQILSSLLCQIIATTH